ncbi:hypothetical protein EB241_21135, partial [Erwinia psidii]
MYTVFHAATRCIAAGQNGLLSFHPQRYFSPVRQAHSCRCSQFGKNIMFSRITVHLPVDGLLFWKLNGSEKL